MVGLEGDGGQNRIIGKGDALRFRRPEAEVSQGQLGRHGSKLMVFKI